MTSSPSDPQLPRMTAPSRRTMLSAGAALGLGAVAAPLLTGCVTPSQRASSGSSDKAGADKPTTDFPSKLWKPSTKAGSKPTLPKRIAWQNLVVGVTALEAVETWIRKAAEEIHFQYLGANSNGNSAQTITQMNQAIARGIMGMVAPAQDLPAQIASMQTAMPKGAAMFLFNTGGVTCGMAAVQYEFGRRIGEFTAKYVKEELGGEGRIAFLNLNAQKDLRPRETGYIAGFTAGGLPRSMITSVAAPTAATQANGFSLMNTLLQKNQSFNVVASAGDDLALGAMAALKAAGKWAAVPKLMVCGCDGNVQAVAAIQAGNTPYKATSAVHFPLVGYAPARLIGRWADGLDIPQFLEFQSFLIDSPDAAAKWKSDQSRCSALYDQMLDGDTTYVAPRGAISFEAHNAYYQGDLPITLPTLQK